tara:strand:+ start:2129 stop:2929 length:801 start_codon:yes stop_codon:yes gene_type:complete
LYRIFFLEYLFFIIICGANAQEIEYSNKSFKNGTIINCKLSKEQEFLEYNIKVGLLSVGEINFRKSNCKDSKLTCAEIKAYTKGIGKLFFNLNVSYKSFFSKKEFTSLKFIKLINEGDDQKQEEIYFNNNLKKAYYQNKENEEGRFFLYENKIFDLISGIYFFRSNMNIIFKDSSSFHMPYIHNGKGIKKLKIELVGIDNIKISNVTLKAKKFLCFFESTNKLLQKKSEVYFWISDDKYNLPLCFETKVRLSKIKIELKNIPNQLY